MKLKLTFVCLSLLALPRVVRAGPVEQLAQLAFDPSVPERMVLRYEFSGDGLLYSDDAGRSFQLLCGSAIDPRLTRIRALIIAADGTALTGAFPGLWQDDKQGCAWQFDPTLGEHFIADFALDPLDPNIVYAVSADGGTQTNGVYRRDARGTWSEMGSRDQRFINRIRAVRAASGSVRLYESAALPGNALDANVVYVVRVSDDAAAHWSEFQHPIPANSELSVEAVDPSDPDAVLFSMIGGTTGIDLLVSFDRGETLSAYAHVAVFGGATFAPDGRLWFGDASNGQAAGALWYAPSLKDAPHILSSDYHVSCVNYQAATDKLFVCEPYRFGAVDPATGAAAEMFALDAAPALRSCAGRDLVNTCETQLLNGYCGVTHFPKAPLCKPYGALDMCADAAAAGCPNAPLAGAGADAGPDAGADASVTATTADSSMLDDAGSEAMRAPDAQRSDAAASSGHHTGGCAVSAALCRGPESMTSVWLGLATCAWTLAVRRRMRRRAVGTHHGTIVHAPCAQRSGAQQSSSLPHTPH